MLVRAHQIVQFFGQIPVFPKNNGALFKYLKEILHYFISATRLYIKEISPSNQIFY